jgi:hypothetical protein
MYKRTGCPQPIPYKVGGLQEESAALADWWQVLILPLNEQQGRLDRQSLLSPFTIKRLIC